MAEKTTRDSLEHFCRGIIDVYGARYLRTPTWDDLQKIYEIACIGVGITARLHGEANTHGVTKKDPLLFFRRLLHRTFGFGRLTLAWSGHAMISMFLNNLRC
uniref:Uncharacterized protein n=1 Tax=Helianthus annuus TaxID=4232 RepID=A0A251TEG0_HELAN